MTKCSLAAILDFGGHFEWWPRFFYAIKHVIMYSFHKKIQKIIALILLDLSGF